MRVYIDSDILVWHLRGSEKATDLLRSLNSVREYELWIGALQRAEIVFFMRASEEKATELFLSQFQTASVSQCIVDVAGKFYRKWNPSHGIDVNDALLAATATETGGIVYSLNIKHFPMPEIIVKKAW